MTNALTIRVPLRYGDFDPNRHVNNVAYFAVMETARIQFLHDLRARYRLGRTLPAHAEIDYLREVPIGTPHVDIGLSVKRIGTSSVTLLHEISDETGVAARGLVVLVAVDTEGKTRPLTDDERAALALYAAPVDAASGR